MNRSDQIDEASTGPRAVCWHEAGHALVAIVLCVAVEKVVVKAGGAVHLVDEVNSNARHVVAIAEAGAIAEQRKADPHARRSDADITISNRAFERLSSGRSLTTIRQETESILRDHDCELEYLAQAFCRVGSVHGGISAEKLDELWQEAKDHCVSLASQEPPLTDPDAPGVDES